MPGERQGTVAVGDRPLAWHAVGAGPPLLLVNGYAATGRDWDPGFILALSRGFRVICPDNRGVGGSTLGEGELTVAGMAADLETLLDALAVERATVAGWSMGGFVAQALAARAPARVVGLALLATDPGAPDAVAPSALDWARLVDHGGTSREQARRLFSLLFPPAVAADVDARFGDVVARSRAALPEATLFAQEAAMEAWHRDGLWKGGSIAAAEHTASVPHSGDADDGAPFPVAIGHGGLDAVIPLGNAVPLARRWPGATVEVFPRCAHALMAQEPARAAALVLSVGPRMIPGTEDSAPRSLPRSLDLEGDGVRLRDWQLEDAPVLAAVCGEPAVCTFTSVPWRYSEAAAEDWVRRQRRGRQTGETLALAILRAGEDEPVGNVNLTAFRDRDAGFGYWLLPGARGQGLASAAARLLGRWGFEVLGLRRIEFEIRPDNVASQRVAEALGATADGLRPELTRPKGATGTWWSTR